MKLNDSGRTKIQKSFLKMALRVQRQAMRNAPVDTGRLRSSITIGELDNRIGFRVGSNVEYAPDQEFGTEFVPAQPFLRPAFRQVLKQK